MRPWLITLLLGVGIPVSTTDALAQSPSPVTLPGTEQHEFVTKSGELYEVRVALPAEYAPDAETTYPILYVTDGLANFPLLFQSYGYLALGGEIQPLIIVGVNPRAGSVPEYLARRVLDLTPTRDLDEEQSRGQLLGHPVTSGGASVFLSVLTEELIPWVESRYRVSDVRGLGGFSLGGLFTTYVLLTSPSAFTHYLIGSPSLWWDEKVVMELESKYAAANEDLPARIFISVGELEIYPDQDLVADARRFQYLLSTRNYPGLVLESHVFEGETHLSVVPATMSRGLRILFGGN